MAGTDAIRVEGLIVDVMPNSLFRVELPNGHRIAAHLGRLVRAESALIASGDKVEVVMTPFDMSQGRITARR